MTTTYGHKHTLLSLSFSLATLMYDGLEWLALEGRQVQRRVRLLVHLANHGNVVPPHNVQAEWHLLHAGGGGKDALMALLEDDVGGLVEPFEYAHNVAAVVGNHADDACESVYKKTNERRAAWLWASFARGLTVFQGLESGGHDERLGLLLLLLSSLSFPSAGAHPSLATVGEWGGVVVVLR